MVKAFGLVRVSTEEQARDGVSLAAQEAKIRAYAALNDIELVDVVVEAGRSGKDMNREGLQSLLARIEACEAQAVIVYKLDRLSRRVIDTLTLIERIEAAGAAFHSIAEKIDTKSAIGRFFLTITAAFAQMERDTIAERTVTALAHKKANGEHVGGVPFGFRVEGTRLVAVDEQKEAIASIRALRGQGLTLRAIAAELNRRGIPSKRGGLWYAPAVKHVLDRQSA